MFNKLSILICLIPISLWAQNENWVYFYDGQEHCSDIARAIVYGTDGNIYIAGESSGPSSTDFTIVSLNSSGTEQWTYNYNGPGDFSDGVHCIIYGVDNNIYVAGYSEGVGTGRDFTVVSLNSSGTERWVYRFNGSDDQNDEALCISYGNDNNIYVAGKSRDSLTSNNFTVISLTSTGSERWVYHYDADSSYDEAYAIAYGDDGNIYVAGRSDTSETGNDFMIISLDSNGSERWRYRYNGPDSLTDEVLCVVYGNDNNIYAGGYCQSSSEGYNLAVISLTSSGSERWIYQYNGPGNGTDKAYAIDYGDDGNIYVAGESNGGSTPGLDAFVVSLNNLGSERWVYRYNGSGNSSDEANSIVYGGDGNIYISGIIDSDGTYDDFAVISLTASGSERWVYNYSGSGYYNYDRAYALVYGTDGHIYVAGRSVETTTDFTVIGLNSGGGELWTYHYNGFASGYERAYQIVYGSDGNIYGIGYTRGIYLDYLMLSVDNSGSERWVYKYNGPANADDYGKFIVYGNDGNIYSVGDVYNHNTLNDVSIISLDNSGQERWIYEYNGPVDSNDISSSIAYGIDGNIYAAGYCRGDGTFDDFLVLSVDNSGSQRWVYTYDGSGYYHDRAHEIVYGDDGNIYASGESHGWGSSLDFVLISLDNSGQENWVYRYNGTGNSTDYPNSIAYGTDGNIYIAGYSYGNGTGGDFAVVSINSSGNERWVYRYNGPANGTDYVNCITYGDDGNIYAAGVSKGSTNSDDFIVISLDSSGQERWVYRYNAPANGCDVAISIVYGADNNIHIAGESWNGSSFDFTVISLTQGGAERWIYTLDGSSNTNDYAYSIVYGTDGNLYIAGTVRNIETLNDFAIVSLDPTTGVEEDRSNNNLCSFHVPTLQLNGSLRFFISYSSSLSKVDLSLFNILGQRVLSKEIIVTSGRSEHNLPLLLPTGIYFLQVKLGDKIEKRKVCILK